jgi:putative membrane protein
MINYNPKTWFVHILSFHKSDTIRILWKEILLMALLTGGITFLELNYLPKNAWHKELMAVYSLVGFVLSLLLVFRTNTGYDRWWEGRKKWGEMVNNTRNLAIKISASAAFNKDDKAFFARMIPNLAFAMKEHLREGVITEELDLTATEKITLKDKNHKVNYITKMLYEKIAETKNNKTLSDEEYIVIDTNLKTFADINGACERIKNTPIPYSYSLFLKKFIFIYVTTMPLAFVASFGYWSVLITTFVFYILVSMEILAEEIEEPFGKDDNDLPTDDLCEKIKANVNEILLD